MNLVYSILKVFSSLFLKTILNGKKYDILNIVGELWLKKFVSF